MATVTATARPTARMASTTGAGTRRSRCHQDAASMPWGLAAGQADPAPAPVGAGPTVTGTRWTALLT